MPFQLSGQRSDFMSILNETFKNMVFSWTVGVPGKNTTVRLDFPAAPLPLHRDGGWGGALGTNSTGCKGSIFAFRRTVSMDLWACILLQMSVPKRVTCTGSQAQKLGHNGNSHHCGTCYECFPFSRAPVPPKAERKDFLWKIANVGLGIHHSIWLQPVTNSRGSWEDSSMGKSFFFN